MKKLMFLFPVLILLTFGCEDEEDVIVCNYTDEQDTCICVCEDNISAVFFGPENFSLTRIDLNGFRNCSVWITIDEIDYFQGLLSDYSPTAGPDAWFFTYLKKGIHQINIRWAEIPCSYVDFIYWQNDFSIGEEDKYILLLSQNADSVGVGVYDYGPLYQ